MYIIAFNVCMACTYHSSKEEHPWPITGVYTDINAVHSPQLTHQRLRRSMKILPSPSDD